MATIQAAQAAPAPKAEQKKPEKVQAQAAKPAAAKPGKKSKHPVDRLNNRVLYLDGILVKLKEELVGQAERLEAGSPHDKLLQMALAHTVTSHQHLEKLSAELFRLKDAKWVPRGGARPFRAGDVVNVRAGRADEYVKAGVYAAADLRAMKVLSVHGKVAKVSSAKGEYLGVFPLSWLSAAAP